MDFFFLEAHALIRDHPCLRGEYMVDYIASCSSEESPPLARGILKKQSQIQNVYGITPACAGNTISGFYLESAFKDHPRLRGEYSCQILFVCLPEGSPPLARGIPHQFLEKYYTCGITPACAGNTGNLAILLVLDWDHPRLRGEYKVEGMLDTDRPGSPPLARGILFAKLSRISSSGITPACAGNTIRYRLV